MNENYVSVPLELAQDEIYRLAMIAHERDITLNALVTSILVDAIARSNATIATTDSAL